MPAPTRTWLALVALTLAALAAGATGAGARLGLAGAALVIAASGFKAVAILRSFLELRRATAGWQAFFYVYLAAIGLAVLTALAFGALRA